MLLHKKKLQSLLYKILYIVLYIPCRTVENWDASSYIPLLFSLVHLIQGHIGILTLERGFDVSEFTEQFMGSKPFVIR